jgi:integrase/recombinase XerD
MGDLVVHEPLTDALAIDLWISRYSSPETRRAYRRDVIEYLDTIQKPLAEASAADTIGYSDRLARYRPASRSRKVGTIKSLYRFLADPAIGYLRVNPWALVRAQAFSSRAEHRILTEAEVMRLLAHVHRRRQTLVLWLLYYAGMRAVEVSRATWGDLERRPDVSAGQITIHGKGGRDRVVLLPPAIWDGIVIPSGDLEGHAKDEPLVVSQKGGPISPSGIWRLVRQLALQAGIDRPVSPHWLRHAHASHALLRGAPLNVIQDDLGHSSIQTTMRYIHKRPTDGSALYLPV